MEKAERMRLQHLRVVQQAALQDGRGGRVDAQQSIAGFATSDDVAHGADAAHARHESGHFVKRAALADLFETAKLCDVELGGLDFAGGVEVDRDLRVAFDPGYRMNDNPLSH